MQPHRRALFVALVAMVVAVGCGPSATQIRAAREARYQGTRDEVFLAAGDALEKSYKIFRSDPEAGTWLTVGRWYEVDGTYADNANANRDTSGSLEGLSQDGSVFLGFLVQVVGDAPPFQVIVSHSAHQVRAGYSAPYKFLPDDPQLPGWIKGKVDDLQLALYERMKGQFIAPPSTVPATPPPAQ